MRDYSKISQVNSFPITEELQKMAYYNWLNAGRPQGRDIEFWTQAERDMFGYTAQEMDDAMHNGLDEYNHLESCD